MQTTANYELKKPDQSDAYNIQNENDNMDIIDKTMKEISDANADIYTTNNVGNNYSVSIPNLTTLRDGYPIRVKFNAASTGEITINPSKLGAKAVVDYFGKPVTNVRKDLIANIAYDATNGNFQLLGKGGGGTATADKILKDETATVDSGPVVGTIPSKGAQTYIPGTTDQIILAGQYIKEQQIILGDPNLKPENIPLNTTIFGIKGTTEMFKHEIISSKFKPDGLGYGDQMRFKLNGTPVIIIFAGCIMLIKHHSIIMEQPTLQTSADAAKGSDGMYSYQASFNQPMNQNFIRYDERTKIFVLDYWLPLGDPFQIEYYYLPN